MNKKLQTTIKDIATSLGVSTSTVSRALNDHHAISQLTKDKIIEKAKELRYEPNIVALSLKNSQTKTIGVILPELVHFFFSTVISGIEEIAYENGYTVMVCQSNESHEKEVKDTMALLSHRVDGLLVSQAKNSQGTDHFLEVQRRGVPLVFFDRSPEDFEATKVIIDDTDAGRKATQHLIDEGCRYIVHLASESNMKISLDRKRGYQDALISNNIDSDLNLIYNCIGGNKDEAYSNMLDILNEGTKVDGVFAGNDLMAAGAMRAIKDFGLKVPEDIAVIGFSNWNFCDIIEPALSSVSQPGQQMGQEAMKSLIVQIESEANIKNELLLQTEVIARESSNKRKSKSKLLNL